MVATRGAKLIVVAEVGDATRCDKVAPSERAVTVVICLRQNEDDIVRTTPSAC